MHDITLIPGDCIGPAVTEATIRVIDAVGVKVRWHTALAGHSAAQMLGTPLPRETINSIKNNGVALKGPLIVERGRGRVLVGSNGGELRQYPSVNNAIRREIGAFVNIRPIRTLPGVRSKYDYVDVIVMREISEGIYSGLEHRIGDHAAEAIKLITRDASERVAQFAFNYARNKGRRKVTAVHKANALSLTDGLFLESAKRIARDNPNIDFEDYMVDNICYQLVRDPSQFDILLATNQYGDIVSDLCAGLVGSLGLAPGANIGDDVACFEPTHGAAPDIASQNIANPVATILSGAMMLDYIGEGEAAARIVRAVEAVVEEGHCLTPDIGGTGSTTQMTQAIIRQITGK